MKKVYLLLLLNSLFTALQAQSFDWAKREGAWAYDYGYGITTDYTGNVYVAGKYEMNANFSDTILPCQGNHDMYLARYTPAGELSWIRTAGGVLGDYAHALAGDGSNYLYVAGEIEGDGDIITFPGSSITLNTLSDNDIFLAKYDLNGNLLWARSAGGYGGEKALGVTYDNAGNVYICGNYKDTATFGGNKTIYCAGERDIFVAKYNRNGDFLWVKHAGGPGREEALSIKCDVAGNIYVCGMHANGAIFGSQTLATPNIHYYNAFLAKYAPDGTLIWVKSEGGDYDDVAWSLTIDSSDKIYVTGEFNAYVLFDNIPLNTSGSADIFVACYDASGNVQWAKKAGGSKIDRARGIGCDDNNIYITGQFGNSATFGSHTINGADDSDVFMAGLNHNGDFIWAKAVGGPGDATETLGYESGNAICADASNNVYATGALLSGGTFGSTPFLSSYDRTDVFVTKISQGPDVTAPATIAYSPADNSIDVLKNSNLVLTFNEPVQKGIGDIVIKEEGNVMQTIDVSGANVTVSGNVVTIDPTADFTDSTEVNIEIAAGVFKDMSNNNYTGIINGTTWNFVVEKISTVAVKENNTQKKFTVYPNPGNSNFTIDATLLPDQKIEMALFNYCGQIIDSRTYKSPSKINIDLSGQAKGIYFIELKADQTIFREKIIFQ